MADNRERNQGMKQGTGEVAGQQAPGRKPQDERAAGGKQLEEKSGQQRGGFDPNRGGDGGSCKKPEQNEQTRR